ncbi:hypothetical protein QBC44DRAFT_152820 [Cladorrhinum sp. PSN332]|nr:hypothetical protein QBC44DRAFT_152820 [Cladorrhinum sp. PSN332]
MEVEGWLGLLVMMITGPIASGRWVTCSYTCMLVMIYLVSWLLIIIMGMVWWCGGVVGERKTYN